MRLIRIAAGFALCWLECSAASAQIAPEAQEWLVRMAQAAHNLNFRGVVVYHRGSELDSVSILHGVVDGVEHERLVYLNGEKRQLFRDGQQVFLVDGDKPAQHFNRSPLGAFVRLDPSVLQRLSDNYSIVLAGQSRVADRTAVKVNIKPRDHFRFGYQLALDKETGLLLGSVMLDQNSSGLERFQYTQLSLGETLSLQEFHVAGMNNSVEPETRKQAEDKNKSISHWSVKWLPPGFVASTQDADHDGDDEPMQSAMYSDGLAVFSVFVENGNNKDTMQAETKNGATLAMSRPIAMGNVTHLVTLVGEVPVVTANAVLRAVEFSSGTP